MKHVLVTETMDESGLELLRKNSDIMLRYQPDLYKDRAALRDALATVEALILRNLTPLDADLLSRAPQLQVIGRLGVGLADNIDESELKKRDINIVTPSGANAVSVAEWTIGAILGLARRFVPATNAVSQGRWDKMAYSGEEIAGKTLGLIGFGDIARKVARRAQAFELKIAAFDPYLGDDVLREWAGSFTRYNSLEELLVNSQIVSLHAPLTTETRYILNAARLAKLPRGAYVINSARGGLVDEAALLQALQEGKLGGVALDAREEEPPSQPDQFGKPGLNVILTPHVGGMSEEAQTRISRDVVEGVLKNLGA